MDGDLRTIEPATVLVAGDPRLPDPLREPTGDVEVVGRVSTGDAAIDAVVTDLPDVVLLDVRIRASDAREVCRRLREWAPATKLVAATVRDDETAYAAVVAGATGAVRIDDDDEKIAHTLAGSARGESWLLPRMAGRLVHDIDEWARRAADPIHPPPTLTATEREVLVRVSEGIEPAEIARIHAVTTHLVTLHSGFAVAKLHRYVHGMERIAADGQSGAFGHSAGG